MALEKVKCKKVKPKKIDKSTVKILWILMIASLVLSLAAQFILPDEKHHFKVEDFPFFNAIFGFISCVVIVLVSKFLGFFFKRGEDYYD